MAYSVHNISAITDVPALIGTFAAANGFDTNLSDPNAPIITCPGDSNSAEENMPMQMRALVSGTNNQNHDLWWEQANDSNSEFDDVIARTQSPKLHPGDGNTPTVPLPTRLHIFGTAVETNSPFIAAVIEYGFNLYRHIFFGKMEALGGYTGREVYAADAGVRSQMFGNTNWFAENVWAPMFGGETTVNNNLQRGGVRIIHGSNPTEFRKFDRPTSNTPNDEYTSSMVVGGYNDGFNEGYVSRAKSPFAGANQLVPINLYAAAPIIGDVSFIPIGRPPGVRYVNMQDLEPGAEIEVGNQTWMVFPAKAKNSSPTSVLGSAWPVAESSYYMGYAYLKEDAP